MKDTSADLIEKPDRLSQTLDAVAHLLGVLAWPLVALAFLLTYRPQIGRLLDRIRAIKLTKEGLEFALGVDEAAEKAGIDPAPVRDPVAERAILSRAAVDARGTVLSAWAGVEQAINNLVRAKGLAPDFARIEQRPYTAMRLIQDAKLLDPRYATLFADLRALRNQAGHAVDFNPPPEAVLRYVALAQDLAQALQQAAGS